MSKVKGFSGLSKQQKINWLLENYFDKSTDAKTILEQYWSQDTDLQELHDGFIENTISNFFFPYAVSPNYLIDGKTYTLPMVIEESSVVAASSKAAKFWMEKGGFNTKILGTTKLGHIYFTYKGDFDELNLFFKNSKTEILQKINPLQENMKKRGGGILSINLVNKTDLIDDYFQIEMKFDTKDSMGANFINTILEETANVFMSLLPENLRSKIQIIMSILSNYNPECLVRSEVSCKIDLLATKDLSGKQYAEKFVRAIEIAEKEPYRAVTHNKGIMNGVDAVVLATGNDFRAIEAGVHAFASKGGSYSSLTHAKIQGDKFIYWIEIPLAVGTVGGLTGLHPLVKFSLQLLQNPSAQNLMRIIASSGLAQNFAAVNALITEGIQQGHMKMHLNNMLKLLEANDREIEMANVYFMERKVNFAELKKILKRN